MTDGERPLVLLTGAGRGYGAIVARELAAEGWRVAALGRSPESLSRLCAEIDGVPLIADILDRAELQRVVSELIGSYGPPEAVVNNAGVGGDFDLMWEADPDAWWEPFEVNVKGTHHVISAVMPAMTAARRGRIINVVSHAGVARWPLGSAYAVSKAAVIKLGENLAAEARRFGVSVINFHPGIMDIGLTEGLFAVPDPTPNQKLVADWFRSELASGHGKDPSTSAHMLVRLASGDFDRLTGRYLTAYDDFDDILARAETIVSGDAHTLGLLRDARS